MNIELTVITHPSKIILLRINVFPDLKQKSFKKNNNMKLMVYTSTKSTITCYNDIEKMLFA